jgi:hypothetical protein
LKVTTIGGFHYFKKISMNIFELQNIISDIGKANKLYFKTANLTYYVNGKTPREISKDYYINLRNRFYDKLTIQLKSKPNVKFFEKLTNKIDEYLELNHEEKSNQLLRHAFIGSKKQLTDSNGASHNEILEILNAQHDLLDQLKRHLTILSEHSEFIIDSDFSDTTIEQIPKSTGLINFADVGKATFKMSKKEALMVLYVLEKTNLLAFDSELQRNKFIEQNFNYTEMRNNADKGNALQMKDVNSEMSNLHSPERNQIIANDKALKKLIKQLDETIMSFKFVTQPKR